MTKKYERCEYTVLTGTNVLHSTVPAYRRARKFRGYINFMVFTVPCKTTNFFLPVEFKLIPANLPCRASFCNPQKFKPSKVSRPIRYTCMVYKDLHVEYMLYHISYYSVTHVLTVQVLPVWLVQFYLHFWVHPAHNLHT